jgi:Tol biopolymer transport system component
MKKTVELKLKDPQYFNPNFTKVDRVLACTEMASCINHKLLNEIKGQWSESLAMVCSKILNFSKNNYPYAIHFSDPYDTALE